MNEISLKFARYAQPATCDFAEGVVHALRAEPGVTHFPNPEPPLASFEQTIAELRAAIALGGTPHAAALRNDLRRKLSENLKLLAGHLEMRAKGDLVILASTGFELKKPTGVRGSGPTPRPTHVRARHGLSRQVILSASCKSFDMMQVAWSHDPNGEWVVLDPVSNSRQIEVNNLERGVDTYLKVRAFGPHGPSDWSHIVSIMVI